MFFCVNSTGLAYSLAGTDCREIGLPPELDQLLGELRAQPVDRSLDTVADAVRARLPETAATKSQTWGLRALALLLVMAGGVFASASTAAAVGPAKASPFAAWSSLAPSTLLERSE